MLIPIRCFSCGKTIANHWTKYLEIIKNDLNKDDVVDFENLASDSVKESSAAKAMKQLKITRMCCKRHFLCNVDLIDII